MISLIICSRSSSISPALATNIASTIGVPYELIVIDNSANNYSIFAAYNIGVARSKYPVLCFMHDDIEYYTTDWGKKVSDHFEDKQTGAIGIAGSPYASTMPGSWWAGGIGSMFMLPADPANDKPQTDSSYTGLSNRNKVLLLDGVWLCIRKALFKHISFDVANFIGFHFYDIDICMQINRAGYNLYTIRDILIRHFGKGDINLNWCNNALIFNRKWERSLPLSSIELSYSEKCNAEYKTLIEYLSTLLANGWTQKKVMGFAVYRTLKYKRGYFYYKTPAFFLKHLFKYIYLLLHNNNSPEAI